MRLLLRFLVFDRPDRQSTTQLHTDLIIDEPPSFAYGSRVDIGFEHQPVDLWPVYVVAGRTRKKRIADPDRPTRVAWLFQVYLAREAEWLLFEELL
jgi:hypothetical protein